MSNKRLAVVQLILLLGGAFPLLCVSAIPALRIPLWTGALISVALALAATGWANQSGRGFAPYGTGWFGLWLGALGAEGMFRGWFPGFIGWTMLLAGAGIFVLQVIWLARIIGGRSTKDGAK